MGKCKETFGDSGFTLIELMIVIVIVAVLATVAYPSYLGYTKKANRAATMAYLMKGAQQQQLFYNDSRTYTTDPNDLNLTAPDRVGDNYALTFNVIADPNEPPTFTIRADPTSNVQIDDGWLTIDNAGEKLRAGEPW